MPRKKKSDSPVAIADTLEALKAEIPGLKSATELPRQLSPAEPALEAEPPPREVVQPTPNTSRPRPSTRRNGEERPSFTDREEARRPDFSRVPPDFINVSRYEAAGIRVNKSVDYRTAAIQFAEDRPLSRATEYDLMTTLQDAGFSYKPASRQWERRVSEGQPFGENILEAGKLAKIIADARGSERGR